MIRRHRPVVLAVISLLTCAWPARAGREFQDSLEQLPQEPLAYDPAPAGASAITLMFSSINLEYLRDTAATWRANGFGGFLLGGTMGNYDQNIWAVDGDPGSVGEADQLFSRVRAANQACARAGIHDNFLQGYWGGTLPDWFDDAAWQPVIENYQQAALFARLSGCRGIALDTEYIGEQYRLSWPGYANTGHTVPDLCAQVRRRMREILEAMYAEFPDMTFLMVHGFSPESTSLTREVLAGWVETAAAHDAPGGAYLLTEGTYGMIRPDWILAYIADMDRGVMACLSPRARRYWQRNGGVAPSSYAFRGGKIPNYGPEEFRAQYAAFVMGSGRYHWVYNEGNSWWRYTPEEVERYHGSPVDASPQAPRFAEYLAAVRHREVLDDPRLSGPAARLRAHRCDVGPEDFGFTRQVVLSHPNDEGGPMLVPDTATSHRQHDRTSRVVRRVIADRWRGKSAALADLLHVVPTCQLIGPFPMANWDAFDQPNPPEQEINLAATYSGVGGTPVRWQRYTQPLEQASVDLKSRFTPTEWVSAYALCYLTVAHETSVQVRAGANDAIKVWLNGKPLYQWKDVQGFGSWAVLDDHIIPAVLPAGTSTLLLRVSQGIGQWGFYLRVTDESGQPVRGLQITADAP